MILKLSAFGARLLHECDYQAKLHLDFVPHLTALDLEVGLRAEKESRPKQCPANHSLFKVTRRFWSQILPSVGIGPDLPWSDVTRVQMMQLIDTLKHATFQISGKGEFKEEFVTAGGVSLKEIDFRTMQSKICAGLYFAGEILDVDGITGGYNFQNAWTTSWIAGSNILE